MLQSVQPLEVRIERADTRLLAEWTDLATATSAPFFSHPQWFLPWADAFSGRELHCLSARRGGELVGVLPVIPGRRTLKAAVNGETVSYEPIIASPWSLADVLAGRPASCPRLSLSHLPASGMPIRADDVGSRMISRELRRSPVVGTVGDFPAWAKSRLSTARAKNMRRLRRRLEELGEVAVEVEDGTEKLDALLDEGLDLEASGWKGRAGTAVKSRRDAHHFYEAMARNAAALGLLRMFFLRLDGKAVGFSLTIQDGNVLTALKIAFDESYRSYAPGVLMGRIRLEYCFAHPDITRFRFAGEAERVKLDWTDEVEAQMCLEVPRPGRAGSLESRAIQAYWDLRETVRTRVPLEVRERIDTSSVPAAARSAFSLALNARAARSGESR